MSPVKAYPISQLALAARVWNVLAGRFPSAAPGPSSTKEFAFGARQSKRTQNDKISFFDIMTLLRGVVALPDYIKTIVNVIAGPEDDRMTSAARHGRIYLFQKGGGIHAKL